MRQPQRTINHAMRQPNRQTINHAYQKIIRSVDHMSAELQNSDPLQNTRIQSYLTIGCLIIWLMGSFQSLKVSKSLSYNVDSHYWLSLIKLNRIFSGVSKDYGFGNCIRCCQFQRPKNLVFSKSSIENCVLGLIKSVTNNQNSMKFLK